MINNRVRRSRNLAKATFFVLLLLSGASVRAVGPCVTNGEPFQVTNIEHTTDGGIVLTWVPTFSNFIFGVFSADEFLGTNTQWVGRIGVWGAASGTMSWTDTTANVGRRFYKAIRILPTSGSDWDADGLTDVWEAEYGLNPFDAGDARADMDGDGVDNLTEYLQGRDPTKRVVADTSGLVNLEVFTPLE